MTLTKNNLKAAIIALKSELRYWKNKENPKKIKLIEKHILAFVNELEEAAL